MDVRQKSLSENSANGMWTDIGARKPSLLNGLPAVLNDQATSSLDIDATATATNNAVLAVGHWSRFVIVNHSAGSLIELIPHLLG